MRAKLTDRQQDVMSILANGPDGGLMCWQIRDRLYPPDSPLRTKRTHGRGASGFNGSIGATGNLAVGRIVSRLMDLGLVHRPGLHMNGDGTNKVALTFEGRAWAAES